MKNKIHSANTHRPLRPTSALAGAALSATLLATLLSSHIARGSSSPPVASPTADPRLVLHARHVPIAGTLGGGTVRGSLYPGFPGVNTLQIGAPERPAPARGHDAHLDLVVVMPGMRMAPTTARLGWRDGAYRGVIALPMFGTYHARLTLGPAGSAQRGTARLSLPLALGH